MKREADFGTLFRHWVMANPGRLPRACTFELKHTASDYIPFSCLEEHQAYYSIAIQHSKKGVLMRQQGSNGEPDYMYYRQQPAFVVIKYPKCFFVISIDSFLLEKERSKRKSLTSERARQIATIDVDL